ncbi:hypothetical protein AYO20_09114 [Fonsecaea nubica]|uniref:Uncharacterized protein n=1 Tax=Fonsecaea nubica TaxID=856822 RepID=A0A178CID3_9EURO|nr:hypothetical protein AYO20_09114 [Fonsecaea nubica]OAL29730.1 hypothetical protein AYO20_09114 [Fonsecaea nubica]
MSSLAELLSAQPLFDEDGDCIEEDEEVEPEYVDLEESRMEERYATTNVNMERSSDSIEERGVKQIPFRAPTTATFPPPFHISSWDRARANHAQCPRSKRPDIPDGMKALLDLALDEGKELLVQLKLGLNDAQHHIFKTLAVRVRREYAAVHPKSKWADINVSWGALPVRAKADVRRMMLNLCIEANLFPPTTKRTVIAAGIEHRIHMVRRTWQDTKKRSPKRSSD